MTHGLDAIQIGVDTTDHMAFYCPDCNKTMRVTGVKTERVIVDVRNPTKPKYDKCTWVYLECSKCGGAAQRKFYWTVEDGRHCTDRTDTGAQD